MRVFLNDSLNSFVSLLKFLLIYLKDKWLEWMFMKIALHLSKNTSTLLAAFSLHCSSVLFSLSLFSWIFFSTSSFITSLTFSGYRSCSLKIKFAPSWRFSNFSKSFSISFSSSFFSKFSCTFSSSFSNSKVGIGILY